MSDDDWGEDAAEAVGELVEVVVEHGPWPVAVAILIALLIWWGWG
jgi:hypothetical protein